MSEEIRNPIKGKPIAILVVGFNNWGKTTIINELFNRSSYYKGKTYSISGVNRNFVVESHSNDDCVGVTKYINLLNNKYNSISNNNSDLFGALCPTIDNNNKPNHNNNDSTTILNDQFFQSNFSAIYLFYLEYKYDFQAKLMINEITNHYKNYYQGSIPLMHITIDADANMPGVTNMNARLANKLQQILSYIP